MLRKILEKVFKRRSSLLINLLNGKHHALHKLMYLKYRVILENYFQNVNWFSFIKLVLISFGLSQIMILQFPIFRVSLPPSPFLPNFTLANWNPLQHNPHHILHQFPYFVLHHLTTSYHKYWIYQAIVSKLHRRHSTLWVKQAIHQKSYISFKVKQHG